MINLLFRIKYSLLKNKNLINVFGDGFLLKISKENVFRWKCVDVRKKYYVLHLVTDKIFVDCCLFFNEYFFKYSFLTIFSYFSVM